MASNKITAFFGKRSCQTSIAEEPQPKQRRSDKETHNDSTSSTSGDHDVALATIIGGSGGKSHTRTSDSRTGRHKSGYDSRWEKTFPWVYLTDDGRGMYCRLCRRFNTRSARNRSVVFNEMQCVSLRRDVLHQHASSNMHTAAVHMEQERLAAESSGGIQEAI